MKVGDEVSCWELNRRGVPQGSVLGPLCFNVFLNDLSYFISWVSLNAYADDQQLYGADSDHEALYARLDHELREASQWFRMNGLMANPCKFQALVLGSTEQDFSFNIDGQQIQRCDDVDLLGVNIDSKLSFDKHILSICSKVNKQLSVEKDLSTLLVIISSVGYIMLLFYLFLITVVMFGTFVANVVKTNWNNLISRP